MPRQSVVRQRGFVLLTVVLVSALLIVSSLMFGAQLMAETRITKTDAVFKSALSIAEAGLSATLSEIRNGSQDTSSDTWAEWLHENDGHAGSTVPVDSMNGTYKVDVTVVDRTEVQTINELEVKQYKYTGNVRIGSTGAVYPPSVAISADMTDTANYSARRKVETKMVAIWTRTERWDPGQPYVKATPGHAAIPATDGYWITDSFGIGHGVFTGGDFSIGGSAQEINGDVYAGGNAYIGKYSSVTGGKVFAHGTLTGKYPAGSLDGVDEIDFPSIDTAYYRALFTAYLNGTFPYNTPFNQIPGTGTGPSNPVAYYTCTAMIGPYSAEGLTNRAVYGVGALAALTTEVTIEGKTYKVIPSASAPVALSYMTNPTASYFVSGDLHISGSSTLTGTLVVDGTIFVNGGAEILAGTKMPALLATGDFIKNNGNATIRGLVYTGGTFTGRGTADIIGALYSRGVVDMKGNMTITYDASLGSVVTGAEWVPGRAYQPAEEPGQEQPYIKPHLDGTEYRVVDLQRLVVGRSWVEVAPGS